MKVGLACDHGGFALEESLIAVLERSVELSDFGADSLQPDDDYPDYVGTPGFETACAPSAL